ncbi:MAG: hypothetical protein MI757_22165, partial [Pirellulales bacterium]|nr:hypothetical protein [Pirellulales bacterium]
MTPKIAFLAAFSVCTLAATGMRGAEKPTAAEIARAIEQLADESFRIRESASSLLWQAGLAAREALEEAAKSEDPERSQRAESILARIRLGILPDTPADVVKLIHQFRDTKSSSTRRRIVQQLSRSERFDTVLALIRSETDEAKRKYLVRAISSDVNKVLAQLLAARDFEAAEDFLEMSWLGGYGEKNYAVYLQLQGRADKEIERLRKMPHTRATAHTKLLIQLLLLKGDLASARSLVDEVAGDGELAYRQLVEPIAFAQRDWKTLARRRLESIAKPTRRPSIDMLSM